jgi:hypothetical protein
MRPMLKYIYTSLLVLAITGNLWSQANTDQVPAFKPVSGIALGVDMAPLIMSAFDKSRSGLGFSGRINVKQKVFAVAELGYEKINFEKSKSFNIDSKEEPPPTNYFDDRLSYRFAYKSYGTYLKAGLEYNLFKVDEANNLDNVLVGFRYGYAIQQHESPSYTVGNGYWSDYTGSIGTGFANTHWVEILFGIRTEIWKNWFMGWTIRASRIIAQNHESSLEPAVIPGFGKYRGVVNAGFSYTIEYQLPFSKRQKSPKP